MLRSPVSSSSCLISHLTLLGGGAEKASAEARGEEEEEKGGWRPAIHYLLALFSPAAEDAGDQPPFDLPTFIFLASHQLAPLLKPRYQISLSCGGSSDGCSQRCDRGSNLAVSTNHTHLRDAGSPPSGGSHEQTMATTAMQLNARHPVHIRPVMNN